MKKRRERRHQARRDYLRATKNRRLSRKEIHKAIGRQLRYVARDLAFVEQLAQHTELTVLSRQQYRNLLVIHELHRQQQEMYRTCSRRSEDRIVSITQPHVRPIVRGKAKANVEFGAKLAISVVDGYALMEKVSWDSFNEGTTLIESVEKYVNRFGCYPEAILADKIYRNRENLRYCKERGIRLSGRSSGDRPSIWLLRRNGSNNKTQVRETRWKASLEKASAPTDLALFGRAFVGRARRSSPCNCW